MMFSLQDTVKWLAGCLMRRNLPWDTMKSWDLLPVVCHGKGKMPAFSCCWNQECQLKTGNISLGGRCSAAAVAGGGLTPCPWPPRWVHRGRGGPCVPRAAWLWGVWGTGGRDVLLDALGCFAEAWARTPFSLQLCRGRPHVPSGFCPLAGHAQSSRCYKYPGTGLPGPAGAGGLLNPSGFRCN